MLAKKLVNKLDEEFDKLDVDKPSSYPKAFLIGAAEGTIDVAIVGGLFLIATGYAIGIAGLIKK